MKCVALGMCTQGGRTTLLTGHQGEHELCMYLVKSGRVSNVSPSGDGNIGLPVGS